MIVFSHHTPEQERLVELALMTAPGDPYAVCARPRDGDLRGLRYGVGMWSQASGDLGRLMERFAMLVGKVRFEDPMGGSDATTALMDTLTQAPEELRDASGAPLWSALWVGRLREVSGWPEMRRAQRMILREELMGSVLLQCRQRDFNSLEDLARVFASAWRTRLHRQTGAVPLGPQPRAIIARHARERHYRL